MYSAWWLVWAAVQAIVLHRLHLGWETSVKDAAVSSVLLAISGLVTLTVYRFYQPGKSNRIYRLLFGLIITYLYCFALRWLLLQLSGEAGYTVFLEQSMPLRFVFALLIISFITILNWLLSTISENKEKEKQQNEIEKMMREAELSRLRQQLQPHFLFNSLNSINALVATRPAEARKMVQQLSDFLRGTLKKDEQQNVRLKEELEHLGLYLDIEKVRFGHRLNVEIETAPGTGEMMIPPLLLQPVVENAIKFGLYDIPGNITIHIACRAENQNLIVEVKNPYDPSSQRSGTGFGLSSIRRRLYLLYMRNDLLQTRSDENTFITILIIPQAR